MANEIIIICTEIVVSRRSSRRSNRKYNVREASCAQRELRRMYVVHYVEDIHPDSADDEFPAFIHCCVGTSSLLFLQLSRTDTRRGHGHVEAICRRSRGTSNKRVVWARRVAMTWIRSHSCRTDGNHASYCCPRRQRTTTPLAMHSKVDGSDAATLLTWWWMATIEASQKRENSRMMTTKVVLTLHVPHLHARGG